MLNSLLLFAKLVSLAVLLLKAKIQDGCFIADQPRTEIVNFTCMEC